MSRGDSGPSTSLVLLVLALATTAVYLGSFRGEWISDDAGIVENRTLHSLTPASLWTLATTRTDGVNYIPLNFISLALDAEIWGLRPAGFHLTNLLLHVANAIAIYFLLLRLGENPDIAAAGSLLWALHPVQVESVAWISERKNVLSTLFFLLALHMYLRWSARPRPRTYLALALFFVAALLSKVNTIVLPAIAATYEVVLRRRFGSREVAALVPLLACGAVVAWLNLHDNPSHGTAYHGGSLVATLQTSATTIPRYLANVVAPFHLSTHYPVPVRASWLDPVVAGAVAIVLGLAALAGWLAWRRRPEAFWLAWFGITLSPMLNLVPFPALMNDRYLYLPLLGMLVPLLRLGRAASIRFAAARWAPVTVAALAVGLGILTVNRVPVFRNDLELWADFALEASYITADEPWGPPPRLAEKARLAAALREHPERAALHNNVGGFAYEEGRFGEALRSLERAAALDPNDPTIALNLGRTYLALGRLDDAVRTLERATELEPGAFFPWLNLARAHLGRRELARARAALGRAKQIKHDPRFWAAFERRLALAEQRAS